MDFSKENPQLCVESLGVIANTPRKNAPYCFDIAVRDIFIYCGILLNTVVFVYQLVAKLQE